MTVDARDGTEPRPPEATFVEGWLTERHEAGQVPDRREPLGTLPEVGEATMTVVTGFVAAPR